MIIRGRKMNNLTKHLPEWAWDMYCDGLRKYPLIYTDFCLGDTTCCDCDQVENCQCIIAQCVGEYIEDKNDK